MTTVLFVSMDGDSPFAEVFDDGFDARIAIAEIREEDSVVSVAVGIEPSQTIQGFLYEGDPQKHETLTFVKEV